MRICHCHLVVSVMRRHWPRPFKPRPPTALCTCFVIIKWWDTRFKSWEKFRRPSPSQWIVFLCFLYLFYFWHVFSLVKLEFPAGNNRVEFISRHVSRSVMNNYHIFTSFHFRANLEMLQLLGWIHVRTAFYGCHDDHDLSTQLSDWDTLNTNRAVSEIFFVNMHAYPMFGHLKIQMRFHI